MAFSYFAPAPPCARLADNNHEKKIKNNFINNFKSNLVNINEDNAKK